MWTKFIPRLWTLELKLRRAYRKAKGILKGVFIPLVGRFSLSFFIHRLLKGGHWMYVQSAFRRVLAQIKVSNRIATFGTLVSFISFASHVRSCEFYIAALKCYFSDTGIVPAFFFFYSFPTAASSRPVKKKISKFIRRDAEQRSPGPARSFSFAKSYICL